MSEIFNSLEGFSLEASRGWKKLASRIVSGSARSQDNENNRPFICVISRFYITYNMSEHVRELTTIFLPFIFAHKLKLCANEALYTRDDAPNLYVIYHACIKRIEIKYEIVPLSTCKFFDRWRKSISRRFRFD